MDPICRYLALFPLAGLAFGVVLPLLLGDAGWPAVGIVITAGGLVVVGARVLAFRALLVGGKTVPGTVIGVSAERGVTRVEYAYSYRDHRYRQANYVMAKVALAEDAEVNVALDPRAPQQSLLRELYEPLG